ncbi:cyclase family protein [Minwuia sp.]|uniref:cyclase family protein n=1 Tax=Minwuia sp. TaxID=2493630 RepID=UPI003A8D0051
MPSCIRENDGEEKVPFSETPLPEYDDLPKVQGLDMPHAWDVYGRDDDLGSINLLTDARVREAASLVRTGQRLNLSLPLDQPDPPLFGRKPLAHDIYALDRNTLDDSVDSLFMQASSQWDGLRHIRAREHGYFTGITEGFEPGRGRLGIEHWVEHGMTGCGVLLDVAGYMAHGNRDYDPLSPHPVSADDLRATAGHQGTEIRTGDMLCIRFGWVEAYRALTAGGRAAYAADVRHAGLDGSEEMARCLWNWHVACITCDNPAVEVVPGDPKIGSLHRRMIPLLGMAFGEMFDFSELARACRDRGDWHFMMTAIPLNLPGAIGSPANALAIL